MQHLIPQLSSGQLDIARSLLANSCVTMLLDNMQMSMAVQLTEVAIDDPALQVSHSYTQGYLAALEQLRVLGSSTEL